MNYMYEDCVREVASTLPFRFDIKACNLTSS